MENSDRNKRKEDALADELARIERTLAPPTMPPLNVGRATHLAVRSLGEILKHRWPQCVPFPYCYIVSTIARDSFIIVNDLIVHDEGASDICVAVAQTIAQHGRQATSFAIYTFLIEQLMIKGRCDFVILLMERLFPSDGQSHPIFSEPDQQKFRLFALKEMRRGYGHTQLSDHINRTPANLAARSSLLCHELGHCLAKLDVTDSLLDRLAAPSAIRNHEEAVSDLLGAALTLTALGSKPAFLTPEMASWLSSLYLVMARISHVLSDIRSDVARWVRDPLAHQNLGFEIDRPCLVRTGLIVESLSSKKTLVALHRWAGIPFKPDLNVIKHFEEYSDILTESVISDYCVMRNLLLDALSRDAGSSGATLELFRSWSYSEAKRREVQVMTRQVLNHDISRVAPLNSPQGASSRGRYYVGDGRLFVMKRPHGALIYAPRKGFYRLNLVTNEFALCYTCKMSFKTIITYHDATGREVATFSPGRLPIMAEEKAIDWAASRLDELGHDMHFAEMSWLDSRGDVFLSFKFDRSELLEFSKEFQSGSIFKCDFLPKLALIFGGSLVALLSI
jgi:hypothetical protein